MRSLSCHVSFLRETWYEPRLTADGSDKVTPARSQGRCAASQAFSCVADVNGAWHLSGKPLIKLSEQEMIDCGGGERGGTRWIVSDAGIASITAAPLANHSDKLPVVGKSQMAQPWRALPTSTVRRFCLSNHDEENILAMLQHGPVSVSNAWGRASGTLPLFWLPTALTRH